MLKSMMQPPESKLSSSEIFVLILMPVLLIGNGSSARIVRSFEMLTETLTTACLLWWKNESGFVQNFFLWHLFYLHQLALSGTGGRSTLELTSKHCHIHTYKSGTMSHFMAWPKRSDCSLGAAAVLLAWEAYGNHTHYVNVYVFTCDTCAPCGFNSYISHQDVCWILLEQLFHFASQCVCYYCCLR